MGLRRSEIIGVKYSDIDYINRTLHVERQLGKVPMSKKEDYKPKTYTKQEIDVKTESSNRMIPIPDIRWHDLRDTYCTILLKNDFNPKAVSKLMGHAKEIITIDVYGDKQEIIEDCLEALEPFINEVLPEEDEEFNLSVMDYMDSVALELVI